MSNLDGNKLGVESATDQFTYPDCRPADETFKLQSVFATITTADGGKSASTDFWLDVYKGPHDSKEKIGTYYNRGTAFNGITPTFYVSPKCARKFLHLR